MTRQVVDRIFPNRCRAQHMHALGKAQGFTNQAPIHMARGQMGAFKVGRGHGQFGVDLFRLTEDDTRFDIDNTTVFTVLDHLQVLPFLAWLPERWRSSASAVVRHLTVDLKQGFAMTAPPIRNQRRRVSG